MTPLNATILGIQLVDRSPRGEARALVESEGSLVFTSLWRTKASTICLRLRHGVCCLNRRSGANAGTLTAISFDEHPCAIAPSGVDRRY